MKKLIILIILFFVIGCRAVIIFAPVYSPHKTIDIKVNTKDTIKK